MTDIEKKEVENFKNFIKSKEKEQDILYENEEFYKDDIEQNELFLKMLKSVLNIIKNQEVELEKKDKIIGKMIDNIMTHYQVKSIRKMCCPTCKIGEKACTYSGIHRNCIERYFERKVNNE